MEWLRLFCVYFSSFCKTLRQTSLNIEKSIIICYHVFHIPLGSWVEGQKVKFGVITTFHVFRPFQDFKTENCITRQKNVLLYVIISYFSSSFRLVGWGRRGGGRWRSDDSPISTSRPRYPILSPGSRLELPGLLAALRAPSGKSTVPSTISKSGYSESTSVHALPRTFSESGD